MDLVVLLVGCAIFVAITAFEQLPVLGWLGWALSLAAWWSLARAASGVAAAGAIGGATGLVGALTAWAAQTGNLFGLSTPTGDRFGAFFGFVGSSLGMLYWPLVGALFCVAVRLYLRGRGLEPR